MRVALLALALLLSAPTWASAEWQIKPFLGLTLGGGTTLVDLENAAGDKKLATGVSGTFLGEVLGIEADVGHTYGFFESGNQDFVLRSGVTTVAGNVVIAMPRRLTEYTLRPYVVGGAGLIRARIDYIAPGQGGELDTLQIRSHLPALDIGGGVVGFLSDRIGIGWDARYFKSVSRTGNGLSIGAEQLSFWRVNMALVVRLKKG